MSSLGGVGGDKFDLSFHVGWGENQSLVVVRPELLGVWLGGGSVDLEGVESHNFPDLLGVSVSWVVLGVLKFSHVELDKDISDVVSVGSDEGVMGINGGRVKSVSSNGILHALLQGVVSIERPHSEVVWFIWWMWESFVWEGHLESLEEFWGKGLEELKHFLILLSSFNGGGVKSESEFLDLVGVGEGVEVLIILVTSMESP